ncbi:MAG: bifunctional UDP-sugar hydrolase/5'-nucleotidase [Propionibacteriaceae bacterium]|nr:bifunctional UDP-sugar hydrolase/5'-nucleotidase [Propionibacteriaceae bacterium]
MTKPTSRWASSLAASALLLGGVTFTAGGAVAYAAPGDSCENPATVSVFEFNDFHGRIGGAAALFTPVEKARADMGADHVLLVSTGDNIGGSTFDSFIDEDNPTIDIMKAAGVEAIATGNHEFDKGFTDLSERVIPRMGVPHLSANIYNKGTTTVAAPLEEYKVFTKAGVRIAYVGAVTGDLPSLVSPAGITTIEAGDPVEAVNRVAADIVAADAADIIIAGFHEGAPDPSKTPQQNAALSPAFKDIYEGLSPDFDVVFNGHTHQVYNWETTLEKPLMQAGSYAENLSRVDLKVAGKQLCSSTASTVKIDKADIGNQQRIQDIKAIAAAAKLNGEVLGAVPVGFANQAVSTPVDGSSDNRNVESPMSNIVAQMFKEQLQTEEDADSFIGVQNPGGTRASFDRGTVTYREAANVLSFANSLMTTRLTGAQVKLMLEQQWQLNQAGVVPSRPFLALGLSDNISYTFDESRARLDRITSISIDGEPIKMDKLYTLGSGSFLITGGDNFFVFNEGIDTRDSGRVDLEAMVEWVRNGDALNPDYSKRGVSAPTVVGTLTEGAAPVEYVLGKPLAGGVQIDTLDMLLNPTGERVSPQLKNMNISAWINDEMVGAGTVTDGVGTVKVAIAKGTSLAAGNQTIDFWVEESNTWISLPVSVKLLPGVDPDKPVDIYTTPGFHRVNGREWITACEKYSITERCTTWIYGTQVELINGKFIQRNGWTFNNLTYKPSPRSVWKGNPLGYTNSWTATDGRKWMTECDTPNTGGNGCRSFIESKVVAATKKADGSYSYAMVTKFVFNNIVMFK